MASSQPFSPLILGISIAIFISLFSPSHSATLTCATQKLPSNRTYANCTDLSALGAILHYTYNATNSSLNVAYTAAPPSSDGWVALGYNLDGGGMVGSQAFIAHKVSGSVTVVLYNLTSYKGIDQVKSLSFPTWGVSAESSGSEITIFAAFKLPEKDNNITQVWQSGPVTGGKPAMHAIDPEHLKAKGPLTMVTAASASGNNSSSGSSAPTSGPTPDSGSGNTTTGGGKSGGPSVMGERFGLGFYLVLVLVSLSFM